MLFAPALILALFQLPAAIVGSEYDSGPIAPAAVMGCTRGMPYYRMVNGVLPEGLHLLASGALVGEPRHAGDYKMTFEVDNGCGRAWVPAELSVRGRPILRVFDTEVELSEAKAEALVRVYADRTGLAYTAETDEPWLRLRPLRGRTPEAGEALAADLLTLELDTGWLAGEVNPDGPAFVRPGPPRQATVRLSCFRCKGTTVRVLVK